MMLHLLNTQNQYFSSQLLYELNKRCHSLIKIQHLRGFPVEKNGELTSFQRIEMMLRWKLMTGWQACFNSASLDMEKPRDCPYLLQKAVPSKKTPGIHREPAHNPWIRTLGDTEETKSQPQQTLLKDSGFTQTSVLQCTFCVTYAGTF